MLRMDQVHVIRHKVKVEGLSIRQVARQLGISRQTVTKYLADSELVRQPYSPRARPIFQDVKPRIDALLAQWAPRTTQKQRICQAPRIVTPKRHQS
jgi:AcrR family transcriptional regulator